MGDMTIPGGGSAWPGAAASFVGIWVAMMAAMMLPSLLPVLWRYRQAVGGARGTWRTWLAAQVALGYFLVWTVLGVAAFPIAAAFAATELHAVAIGAVVLAAGALQLTSWKARHLACFRMTPARRAPSAPSVGAAWKYGLGLGRHCAYSCAGLTATLLLCGAMDVRAMAIATAVVTAERVAPAGQRVARAVGAIGIAAGALLIARGVTLG